MRIYLETKKTDRNVVIWKIKHTARSGSVEILPESSEINSRVGLFVTDHPDASNFIKNTHGSKSRRENHSQLCEFVKYLDRQESTLPGTTTKFRACLTHKVAVTPLDSFMRDLKTTSRGNTQSRSYSSQKHIGTNYIKIDSVSKNYRPVYQSISTPTLYISEKNSTPLSIFHNPSDFTMTCSNANSQNKLTKDRGYCDVCDYKDIINDRKEHCEGDDHKKQFADMLHDYPPLSKCPANFERIELVSQRQNNEVVDFGNEVEHERPCSRHSDILL